MYQKFSSSLNCHHYDNQKVYKIEFKFVIEENTKKQFSITDLSFNEESTQVIHAKHILEKNIVLDKEIFMNCISRGSTTLIIPNGSRLDDSKKIVATMVNAKLNVDNVLTPNLLQIQNNISGKQIKNISQVDMSKTTILDGYTSQQYSNDKISKVFEGGFIRLANWDNRLSIKVPKNEQVIIKMKYKETVEEE